MPPRANWILKNSDPLDSFIANLRTQIVSFPSTAFRTEVFGSTVYPWLNSTFSDSELTLRMSAKGCFQFLKEKTMNYRENSLSESHSISSRESDFGVGVSLARVFSSDDFKRIAKTVELHERGKFLAAITDSISLRLGNTEYAKFIQFLAAENCMMAWEYSEKSSIEQVIEYCTNLGTESTLETLSQILKFLGYENSSLIRDKDCNTTKFLDNFVGSNDININFKNNQKSLVRKIYDKFSVRLPFRFQMYFGKFLLQLKIRLHNNHLWNFKWR